MLPISNPLGQGWSTRRRGRSRAAAKQGAPSITRRPDTQQRQGWLVVSGSRGYGGRGASQPLNCSAAQPPPAGASPSSPDTQTHHTWHSAPDWHTIHITHVLNPRATLAHHLCHTHAKPSAIPDVTIGPCDEPVTLSQATLRRWS